MSSLLTLACSIFIVPVFVFFAIRQQIRNRK